MMAGCSPTTSRARSLAFLRFDMQRARGIGKPEPLKADLTGYWSRRINNEHRLVDSATATEIIVIACRYHYSK
jgi:toxin YoeB